MKLTFLGAARLVRALLGRGALFTLLWWSLVQGRAGPGGQPEVAAAG